MIRHIVIWTLRDKQNIEHFRKELLGCKNLVPGIIEFEVGVRNDHLDASVDICLVSSFEDRCALQSYIEHPQHSKLSRALAPMRRERHVIDYEVEIR